MRSLLLSSALALALVPWLADAARAQDDEFTDGFPIADCSFRPWGGNAYFSLRPGREAYYNNQTCVDEGECDEFEENTITVLWSTRWIRLTVDSKKRWIPTRVIREYELADGELSEISWNYFAECRGTGDVYYFGEDVDIYEDGEVVSHEGAWLAGRDGAMPGIIMPGGAFLLGARYYQEVAPGVAEDRGEHVDMDQEVEVPAGEFEGCVEVEETTPLDPGEESSKVYCPGTGLVVDDDFELVSLSGGRDHSDD